MAAIAWFAKHAEAGWASCPLTQNGCIRVMSSPWYANPQLVHALARRLDDPCAAGIHEFWPDVPSLLDSALLDATRIHGPRRVTDAYLLGLAVWNGGRLVAFDGRIALQPVRHATGRNREVRHS